MFSYLLYAKIPTLPSEGAKGSALCSNTAMFWDMENPGGLSTEA